MVVSGSALCCQVTLLAARPMAGLARAPALADHLARSAAARLLNARRAKKRDGKNPVKKIGSAACASLRWGLERLWDKQAGQAD